MIADFEWYLARIEEPRRTYARAYAEWLAAADGSAPPEPEGLRQQTAAIMRRRIDQLSKGREFHPTGSW